MLGEHFAIGGFVEPAIVLLADADIVRLLAEPKPEIDPRRLLVKLEPGPDGHRRVAIPVRGDSGSQFGW